MKDVQRFFKSRHRGQFKIYNLCSERTYSAKKFSDSAGGGGKAAHYPFEDHNAPTLVQLLEICELDRPSRNFHCCALRYTARAGKDMQEFLKEDDRNVVAVHCKAGKGRTGTVIAAYMLYANEFDTSDEALAYFGVCRTVNGKVRMVFFLPYTPFQSIWVHVAAGGHYSESDPLRGVL
eukprot:COSAG05_NODE_3377_length_2100_cov_10.836744_1_plen_178_part_00